MLAPSQGPVKDGSHVGALTGFRFREGSHVAAFTRPSYGGESCGRLIRIHIKDGSHVGAFKPHVPFSGDGNHDFPRALPPLSPISGERCKLGSVFYARCPEMA